MQVETLKTGIRILSRAIEEQAERADDESLTLFAKGLEMLDDYDHEALDIHHSRKASLNTSLRPSTSAGTSRPSIAHISG